MAGQRPASAEDQARSIATRAAALDWPEIAASLDARGYATTAPLIEPQQCRALVALYGDAGRFRSRVVMERHAFGRGEYQYFSYPLPEPVAALRQALYPNLVPVANRWSEALGRADLYPPQLPAFLRHCHAAGQTRPTPLMLKYQADDYNCLHQDLYGPLVFPLQATILLSAPGTDFEGGEFLLMEQRPRAQSRGEVVPLAQGEAVIFAVHHRPVAGKRGPYRVNLRHGVSRVRSGHRFTLGLIFHDAA
ncbi:MAG: 2OG-Fe(II) oxygenase [Proteobacteria bacterium]|nr:2OG-Fe(II) oxygenase [Pseudomonadota bacterium]MBI3497088.1 2OG-Fe(II) oxygenase [Pseudomonadota bacterium]